MVCIKEKYYSKLSMVVIDLYRITIENDITFCYIIWRPPSLSELTPY